jgi:hypothetical protein
VDAVRKFVALTLPNNYSIITQALLGNYWKKRIRSTFDKVSGYKIACDKPHSIEISIGRVIVSNSQDVI